MIVKTKKKMVVTIPANIDVAKLLKKEKFSKTKTKSMRDGIYYFLSLLTRTNDNTSFLYDTTDFKKICSGIQKKLHGNEEYYTILKILESKDDPIIERNKSWKNTTKENGFCQGFRITKKYDTGYIKTVRINKKLSNKIINNSKSEIVKSYRFLTDQFKINKISIDAKVYQYIKNYYIKLKTMVKENKYQILTLKNQIGKLIYYIKKIENEQTWSSVSTENHRLNSTLTSLPKELRKFILINNKPIEMIDIKSSQPYILSSIIKSKFYFDEKDGYNIKTIYPQGYNIIKTKINDSNNFYSNNSFISNTSPYKLSATRSSLYMWCLFFTENEAKNLTEFDFQEFENDFYMDIINRYQGEIEQNLTTDWELLREKIKGVMMLILFDSNFMNRNNNVYIKLFQKVYPGVNAWIEKMHNILNNNRFSYLLQRTESYLVLNSACREFYNKYKEAPIFTIHDALYTDHEHIEELKEITESTLYKLTGKKPGLKHTAEKITVIPDEKEINKVWGKIRSIKTLKKYNGIQRKILEININLADEFLQSE
jgi:hypothetical protein